MPIQNGKFRQKTSRERRSNRSNKRVANNLGQKSISGSKGFNRKGYLDEVDSYLKSTQYDHLADWQSLDDCGDPIALRKRKPKMIYNLGKRITDTLASKLIGPRVFPTIKLDQDPITKELFDHLINITNLKATIIDVARYMASHGSCFLRFKFVEGKLKVERFNPNYCYPEFDASGELDSVEIRYVFDDVNDLDEHGAPKKKWFKMELGKMTDTLYDSPEMTKDGSMPEFKVVKENNHNLEFVQGEWFRVGDDEKNPDGPSLVKEIMGFIDAFNYSLSQSDQAVSYNQEPQLVIKGMNNEEINELVKSSTSAWAMGREGEAAYLESSLNGVEKASDLRDKFKESAGDITRVVLQDPEKIVGSAQSAKAMEILHGPLLDLIDEYRPYMTKGLVSFLQKMTVATLFLNSLGAELAGITIPQGYKPLSLSITLSWPAVFPMTMSDLQQKVSVAVQASSGNLISRETMTAWLATDFNIENIEEEVAKIAAQPVINPFGF